MDIRSLPFETQIQLALVFLRTAHDMAAALPATFSDGPFPPSFVVCLEHARILLEARRTVGVLN